MAEPTVRVLLIDDDSSTFELTRELFQLRYPGRFVFDWAGSFEEGLSAIRQARHDVYLVDHRIGGQRGVELVAAVAATLSTIAATMAAIATTRTAPYRGLTFIYVMINQPLMVPEIVTAVALLIFFGILKVATGYQGLGYLIAAHTAFCIPFAYLPIRARLESMDLSLETAAADLYASPVMTFRRVTLPLLAPGIMAGAMLAFVISLDDVVITEFVKSGGQDTLPTYMLGQLRRAFTPEVNAISTMLLGVTVVMLTAFFLLTRKKD